jgi:hypothetical protein
MSAHRPLLKAASDVLSLALARQEGGTPMAPNTDTAVQPGERIRSFAEFWPFYVSQHALVPTRLLHLVGTSLGFVVLVVAIVLREWWLLPAVPVVAYGFAWTGHFFVERNRPATFSYPLWSLRGDWRMFVLMLRGRMAEEVRRLR